MTNQPLRIYVDTCVFGGAFDAEFSVATVSFFDMVRAGRFQLIISSVVVLELNNAPMQVKNLFADLQEYMTILDADAAALALQRGYLDAGIVSPKWADDALHVALATTSQCDLIVSWNFKHIVNYRRMKLYCAINDAYGYPPIEIYTPEEMLDNDEE